MNFRTDELRIARQASYLEASALGLSFLSPLLGPLAAVPAVLLAHLARFKWRQTSYDNYGGTALFALFVGYSFLVSLQVVAMLIPTVFLKAETSASGIIIAYWLIGLLVLTFSSWPYLFTTRPRLTCNATVLLLAGTLFFGLCACGIQQSRENSRRNRAMHHLKTIGIGMHRARQVGHSPDRYREFISEEDFEPRETENIAYPDLR